MPSDAARRVVLAEEDLLEQVFRHVGLGTRGWQCLHLVCKLWRGVARSVEDRQHDRWRAGAAAFAARRDANLARWAAVRAGNATEAAHVCATGDGEEVCDDLDTELRDHITTLVQETEAQRHPTAPNPTGRDYGACLDALVLEFALTHEVDGTPKSGETKSGCGLIFSMSLACHSYVYACAHAPCAHAPTRSCTGRAFR